MLLSGSRSPESTGSPMSAGAMMGEPGVWTSSSIGSGSRGGRDTKDMLLKLFWLGRPRSLESKGDNGEVCPAGAVAGAAAATGAAALVGWGTSTGLLGAVSRGGAADLGTGTVGLESSGREGAPVVPDFVEPAGEAANEVMGRAWAFSMWVEPWAWASEGWAGAAARWLCTEMGGRMVLDRWEGG